MITIIYGINASKVSKLNKDQFTQGIKKLRLDLYDNEINLLFKTLDTSKLGYLTF